MDRRDFIRSMALAAGGYILGFPVYRAFADADQADLVIVRNGVAGIEGFNDFFCGR